MMRHALDGLTVLDFTHIGAGPTCTMLLADMGARVIKVEPPQGELGRQLGPAWIGDDSALYHAFNRNKLGLSLDLKTPQGVEVARTLARTADVLVESMRPGVMQRIGLGYDVLSAHNPGLVYASISAYGQDGPYAERPGVDGIIQADSGLMSIIGTPASEPCKVQAPVVDVFTGYVAALGILAKMMERRRDGKGGQLDINLLNAALALQQPSIAGYLADGVLPKRQGSAAPYSAPNEAFETADGWIMVAAYNGGRWDRLCEVLGRVDLIHDQRFETSATRVANREAMRDTLGPLFKAQPSEHWLAVLRKVDVLCTRVADYTDLVGHPQVAANAMIAGMSHPALGTIQVPGFPINSRESNAVPHAPAPALGEHSADILASFGFSRGAIAELLDRKVIGSRHPRTAP
ncbi:MULTISPECIES: CaiB/BaiF CoA transferase family protein [Azospirillum]|uniref:CoA transferase n=1 Tax=Azospirillum brasilense TaxID=192 RepID=A0ABU4PE33_AZOBR|nr:MULTISPECIES: CoA transferase [Azospirillum]ALJ39362.1 carnitine dehydratase [Azospirillum brasilense]MDX5955858.1 CoA transferase [Azospirillum brasilense]NUB23998.1 CoA transferase [Azospirillum brasilense]NUB33976.1 CoA transferase [Azospirillum brasilense]PWC87403.1 carnitine dehydratase [Azospirillum sp. Sp 7]